MVGSGGGDFKRYFRHHIPTRRRSPPLLTRRQRSTIVTIIHFTTSHHLLINMDALVAKLQPQSFRREEEEEDSTGYGNLDNKGFVTGMALPRVADVSVRVHLTSCRHISGENIGAKQHEQGIRLILSQQHSCPPTLILSPPTLTPVSSWRTERPPSHSNSKGVSSLPLIREPLRGATLVS